MKSILLVALLMPALSAFAQDILRPGAKQIETKYISNEMYTMKWYAVMDSGRLEIGEVKTTVSVAKQRVTIVSEVKLKKATTPWIDSTIADLPSLEPVRHSSRNMQRDMDLQFGRQVTGFYYDKIQQKNTPVNDNTTAGYFDSNIYPSLIRWLPLKEGYTQDIAVYDFNPQGKTGVQNVSVTSVEKGEYQSSKSGKQSVWVVTVKDGLGSAGSSTSKYYIDCKTRKLWKQEINAGGRIMQMETIE